MGVTTSFSPLKKLKTLKVKRYSIWERGNKGGKGKEIFYHKVFWYYHGHHGTETKKYYKNKERKKNKEKEQSSKGFREEIAFAGIAYELSLDKRKSPNQINGRKVRLW